MRFQKIIAIAALHGVGVNAIGDCYFSNPAFKRSLATVN